MMSKQKKVYFFGLLSIVVAVIALSSSAILVRLSTLGPAATGLYRISLALPFIVITLYYIGYKKKVNTKVDTVKNKYSIYKSYAVAAIAGIIFGSDMVVWNKSVDLTTITNSTLLGNMSPIFTIPLTAIFFKEKIPKVFLFSVALSLSGLILLFISSIDFGINIHKLIGNAMAFFTALTYAVFLILVSISRENLSATKVMLITSLGALASLIVITFITEKVFIPQSLNEIWALLALGVLVQVIGQGGLIFGLKKVPVNLVSILILLEPVIASIIAYFQFQEVLSMFEIMGGSLIIIGMYLANRVYYNKLPS